MIYAHLTKAQDNESTGRCVECGACEEACPQQIEIIDWLKRVQAALGEPAGS